MDFKLQVLSSPPPRAMSRDICRGLQGRASSNFKLQVLSSPPRAMSRDIRRGLQGRASNLKLIALRSRALCVFFSPMGSRGAVFQGARGSVRGPSSLAYPVSGPPFCSLPASSPKSHFREKLVHDKLVASRCESFDLTRRNKTHFIEANATRLGYFVPMTAVGLDIQCRYT